MGAAESVQFGVRDVNAVQDAVHGNDDVNDANSMSVRESGSRIK